MNFSYTSSQNSFENFLTSSFRNWPYSVYCCSISSNSATNGVISGKLIMKESSFLYSLIKKIQLVSDKITSKEKPGWSLWKLRYSKIENRNRFLTLVDSSSVLSYQLPTAKWKKSGCENLLTKFSPFNSKWWSIAFSLAFCMYLHRH